MSDFLKRLVALPMSKRALLAEKLAIQLETLESRHHEPIAVIGIGCRFPGGDGPDSFWRSLYEGVDSVDKVPADRWDADSYYDPDPEALGSITTRSGAFLGEIDGFDAHFFDIAAREAETIDPQHHLLLEVSWEALENAAQAPDALIGSHTGLFIGIMTADYYLRRASTPDRLGTGVAPAFAAGRISHALGLRGPSMAIDTQCSSSLVCVHLACESLRRRECDLALAGGVAVMLEPDMFIALSRMRILAPDGRCKSFDAGADGYGCGEGCGVVVLKRLSDAIADGDNIVALVRGSAVNHDGDAAGLTVPNGLAQEALIRDALERSGIGPNEIGYLEAHGTGTQLGDIVEGRALATVFGGDRPSDTPLFVGSVKTNTAHMLGAAGVAGLIKTVLSLKNGLIPPNLHFHGFNPHVDFDEVPVVVPTERTPWPGANGARFAGISSFGLSGTNAHVIVSDYRGESTESEETGPHLLFVSAKTSSALEASTSRLSDYLRTNPDASMADVAHTLRVGRSSLPCRRTLVCRDVEDALQALEVRDPARLLTGLAEVSDRPVAFMFSGVGDQYANMGEGLYRTEPVFRDSVDECAELLTPHLGVDLRQILYEPNGSPDDLGRIGPEIDLVGLLRPRTGDTRLQQTTVAQPAVFMISYAMARFWMSLGVRPSALMGHSIGEIVAAHLAGVFELDDAAKLVARRAMLIDALPGGKMLAVNLAEQKLQPLLGEDVDVSAINGPSLCVVAGEGAAVERLEKRLQERNIACRWVAASHAFHSRMLAGAVEPLRELIASIERKAPSIPIVSNVTGSWMSDQEATSPDYWAHHLCAPVRFADCLSTVEDGSNRVLVEVGPGQALTSFALQRRSESVSDRVVVPSIRSVYDRQSDTSFFLHSLGKLWLAGVDVSDAKLYGSERRRRLPLPTYPFERSRFELPSRTQLASSPSVSIEDALRKQELDDWFYVPVWKQTPLVRTHPKAADGHALVFADGMGMGRALSEQLALGGYEVSTVLPGTALDLGDPSALRIDPRDSGQYGALIDHLVKAGRKPSVVFHLWSLTPQDAAPLLGRLDQALESGFFSILFTVQALFSNVPELESRVVIVSNGVFDVTGGDELHPDSATLLGPTLVIPTEVPNLTCKQVDITMPTSAEQVGLLAARLAGQEISCSESIVAYRGTHRWVRQFEALRLEAPEPRDLPLRDRGVYLITGGLGGIGLAMSKYLAETLQARLVLVGRSSMPARQEWERWLCEHDDADPTSNKIRQIQELEDVGAEVLIQVADVAKYEHMKRVANAAKKRFGELHGVIHAAGVPGAGLTVLKSKEMAAAVLNPKVRGALVLDEVFANEPLDFMALFGSMFSTIGAPGRVDYAAGNAFLDALARDRSRRTQGVTVSIGWGAWKSDTWQDLLADVPEVQDRMRKLRERVGIEIEEGMEAFRRCLGSGFPNVMVSTQELSTVASFAASMNVTSIAGASSEEGSRHARPDIPTPYVAPTNEREAIIAAIFAEVLGLDRVGIHDSFFDFGGNSLLGVQILSRIGSQFSVTMPMQRLFETPTISAVAAAIDVLAEASAEPSESLQTPRVSIGDSPLAPIQERFWYMAQMDPDNLYHVATAVRVRGSLDADRFDRALTVLVRRHDILCAGFPERGGRPVMVTTPPFEWHSQRIDLREVDASTQEARWRQLARELAETRFDLAKAPLLRVSIMQLSDEEHVAVFVAHHIISDWLSGRLLLAELAEIYESLSSEDVQLELAPATQYSDFARTHLGRLNDQRQAQLLAYWRERFPAVPEPLEIPADYRRPNVPSGRGATLSLPLSDELVAKLNSLARAEHCTLYMILMAAFQTLLWRYTGQTQIVIGTPITLRDRPELERLIGPVIETLAIPATVTGSTTLQELLGHVRAEVTGAYDHRDMPFEQLVRTLGVTRNLSRSPLFQVMFAVEEGISRIGSSDITFQPVDFDRGASPMDLSLFVQDRDGHWRATIEYTTDLFKGERIARMLLHYQALLESIVANPVQLLSELSYVTESERKSLLSDWNDTARAYPLESTTLQGLVEASVDRNPERVALVDGEREWTFEELDERANKLAHWLREQGVEADQCVGVMMERSVDMVLALYAIVKAGGAYLPLDPEYPAERVHYILDESGARCALTQEALRGALEGPDGRRRVLALDSDWEQVAACEASRPDNTTRPDHLAYIIYTSGSTGNPKGVMIEHRGICNRLLWMQDDLSLRSSDRVLQKTPYTFDVSVWEFFLPLMAGATLVVAKPGGHKDSEYLVDVLREQKITYMHFVPSMLHVFLSNPRADRCTDLQRVICSGEALSRDLQDRFFERFPSAELHNLYGPTEASVDVTAWRCDPADPSESVPIGRPVANTQIYILDASLEPVAPGVAGELYIGGVQVARGYLARPDLTEERFLPDPFSDEPGATLYHTGDLARLRADGVIEYLGRNDFQVKIRGLRIELGEIEEALRRNAEVSEAAAAVVHHASSGSARIDAYVVRRDGTQADDLNAFLHEALPSYMVPQHIHIVPQLPLTPAGKVDRRALKKLSQTSPTRPTDGRGPRTEREQALAGIWETILGVQEIGIDQSFFDLGGDSILAIHMIAAARAAGLRLRPRQIFEHPTIAELATAAEDCPVDDSGEQQKVTGRAPLTPVQEWFLEGEPLNPNHYNMPVLLLANEPLDSGLLEQSLRTLVNHHDALRASYRRTQGGWEQWIAEDETGSLLSETDLSDQLPVDQSRAMQSEGAALQASFDVTTGPLLRARLFDLGNDEPQRLLLVIHHLAADVVSLQIVLRDLETVYAQLCRGESERLPPRTTSIKEWMERLTQHARSESIREEFPLWRDAADPAGVSIPLDFSLPDEPVTEGTSRSHRVSLGGLQTKLLLEEAPLAFGCGVEDLLVTAVARCLREWLGSNVIRISMGGHGRPDLFHDVDLSSSVGWFTSIYPLRLELPNSATPRQSLLAVQRQLEQVPNDGIGYGLLRYLVCEPDVVDILKAHPMPEVTLNYLGRWDQLLNKSSLFSASDPLEAAQALEARRGDHHARRCKLEITALVYGRDLHVDWSYSEALHRPETIARLAEAFLAELRNLVSVAEAPTTQLPPYQTLEAGE